MLLSAILFASVVGSLLFAGVLVAVQIIIDIKERAKLRRLKYVANDKWVVCKQLDDPQAFHLFLSHAWPAAQDRMRIVTLTAGDEEDVEEAKWIDGPLKPTVK